MGEGEGIRGMGGGSVEENVECKFARLNQAKKKTCTQKGSKNNVWESSTKCQRLTKKKHLHRNPMSTKSIALYTKKGGPLSNFIIIVAMPVLLDQ